MLDKLPAWARHLVLMIAPVVLAWIASDVIPALETGSSRDKAIAYGLGLLITIGLAWLTPLTRQYGVGAVTAGDG